ncbi:MAG: bifunctional folylpolyglutamate synthase/dihydrofolate synthase [Oscillospiraceae bacterium]|nr:bifunctional folylpolyglutamate synthase/dihydrofolate synthase [Oscillospiraceae bacterium]
MTYEEALQYIHGTPNFARSASLHRMQALMEQLGNPQKRLRFVHIAGTNGKGSTAAMVASVLQTAGYRTGLYTSPYLERFNERIQLNGTPIPDEELAAVTERVKAAADAVAVRGVESPNEFELVTAIGFCWYAQRGAEVVVLEVGLGGRYDATNVIEQPLACAITSISLDHTAVLGNTVEEIAGEKAGILKPGSPCVLSPGQPESVCQVVCQTARQVGCPLLESSREQISVLTRSWAGMTFSRLGRRYTLPLLGDYQADNLCTALNLLDCLQMQGLDIPDSAVQAGLAQVRWPGRLELLAGRTVLLDCCHNPDGIASLCRALDSIFSGIPVTAVMGMLRDKDYETGIKLVAERSVRFYAVAPPSPRALEPETARAVAAQVCGETRAFDSVKEALHQAEEVREQDGIVLVCGSIPLVGEARQYFRLRQ